ncbi:MAG: 3-deoxy-manno-octulosonate cytidylyltransferase [Bdellovibrionales bacterium]
MSVYVVIPSRYGSTRFPGKPLYPILGVPLLQRVIHQVQKIQKKATLLVATDDSKIYQLAEKSNIQVVMTDENLQSGTDRIYQALLRSEIQLNDFDIVINVQGDEPLIPPQWIDSLIQVLECDNGADMATLAHPISWEELENLNSVKVVVDQKMKALYFSRFPIPHSRQRGEKPLSLKHVGIYAYRFKTLKSFCSQKASPLELSEGLEQLRAMDLGFSIHVIQVEGAIQGVDAPEDVQRVEEILLNSKTKDLKK